MSHVDIDQVHGQLEVHRTGGVACLAIELPSLHVKADDEPARGPQECADEGRDQSICVQFTLPPRPEAHIVRTLALLGCRGNYVAQVERKLPDIAGVVEAQACRAGLLVPEAAEDGAADDLLADRLLE